ncbi:hypothetical protein X474_10650 [Dethiosulfatarculus sandiegensis]|uniref:Uncharacterized protein n=1 Tax=Dethiosulfatarculus sandiegensis TaxID=1429043 RepID=A0A0D2JWZ2_9BACT|nr:hypothetical protein X474_10650 [Dethiosulfatarculus sandiegensis]
MSFHSFLENLAWPGFECQTFFWFMNRKNLVTEPLNIVEKKGGIQSVVFLAWFKIESKKQINSLQRSPVPLHCILEDAKLSDLR